MTVIDRDTAVIPGLPGPLQIVPTDRARWEKWRDAVIAYRQVILDLCEKDSGFKEQTRAAFASDPALALALFGTIYEPRKRPGQPAGRIPFVPFAYQIRVLRRLMERLDDYDQMDLFISKARALGLSWTICWAAVWGMLTQSPWDVLLASRNDEYVDKPGHKKALFWKCDYMLDGLPDWLKPEGFSTKRGTPTRADSKILNPENGNTIVGESSTANLGRGDRFTWAFVDEPASFPDFGAAWDTLEGSTDHRFAGGTEMGDTEFHRMWTAAKANYPDTVMELNWYENPYNDSEWYDRTYKRYESQGRLDAFRREYLREAMAGMGEMIYPMADRIEVGQFPYEPRVGQVFVSIDPGLRDATALHVVQFHSATGRYRLIETYENAAQPARFYASLLVSTPLSGAEGFDYREREYRFMDLMESITDPIIYIGDPYGRNRGGSGGQTFYETLKADAQELSNGHKRISVVVSYDPDDTSYAGRRDALATLIPMMDFNDTPDVRITLQAIREHRYKTIAAGRDIIRPANEPVHGWGSHRVTSLEFMAVHQRGGRKSRKYASDRPMGPQRVGLNGKTRRGRNLGLRGQYNESRIYGVG